MATKQALNEKKATVIAVGIVAGLVSASALLSLSGTQANAKAISFRADDLIPHNARLGSLIQRDLRASDSEKGAIRSEVRELVQGDQLKRSDDFRAAASLLVKSENTDDVSLAHDLTITALAKGDSGSATLAFQSQEKLLTLAGMKSSGLSSTLRRRTLATLKLSKPAFSPEISAIVAD